MIELTLSSEFSTPSDSHSPLMSISVSNGKVCFSVVFEALRQAGIFLKSSDRKSVLRWYDSLREIQSYKSEPWQVINRIPDMRCLSGKAFFVRIMNDMHNLLPDDFNFIPRSLIIPYETHYFRAEFRKMSRRMIVKSNGGSLGAGITIIEPGEMMRIPRKLSIAQDYIPSYLIDGYKFDIRVYALVIAGDSPQIYIYNDGVVRFCSEMADGNSKYSQLTNVALNKKNPGANMDVIVNSISQLFCQLRQNGVDTKALWTEIKRVITLSILAMSGVFMDSVDKQCPPVHYPRCFQLLGFDVLIDPDLKPWVLEFNNRPSLKSVTQAEHDLKLTLLTQLFDVVAPYSAVEQALRSGNEWWTPEIELACNTTRVMALARSDFEEVDWSKYELVYRASRMSFHSIEYKMLLPPVITSIPELGLGWRVDWGPMPDTPEARMAALHAAADSGDLSALVQTDQLEKAADTGDTSARFWYGVQLLKTDVRRGAQIMFDSVNPDLTDPEITEFLEISKDLVTTDDPTRQPTIQAASLYRMQISKIIREQRISLFPCQINVC